MTLMGIIVEIIHFFFVGVFLIITAAFIYNFSRWRAK